MAIYRIAALFIFASSTFQGQLPAAEGSQRPNIVWIFVEDMNDWMGCYGDDTVATPNLDKLAREGIRFDRAYMPAGVCSATRSAIALGAMQTSLGVQNHRSSRRRVPGEEIHLPEGVKTVYELMRKQGYFVTTQGMNKNDFNFLFEAKSLYNMSSGKMLPPLWRKRQAGQPFFAQIQLKGGKSVFGKLKKLTDPEQVEVMPYYPDHPAIRQHIALHYDCIRQTDNEVGRIMEVLAEDGLLENTVVFFWTDHGMMLPRHKQWLYEGGIRVPLLIAGPGLPQNAVRDDLVSGIDITVATLALAGLEKPYWMEGRNFLAPDHQPREFVISARDRCDFTIERVRAVTTNRYKYLRNFLTDRPFMQPQYRDGHPFVEIPRQFYKEGRLNAVQAFMWSETRAPEEFYDLEKDPHETINLAGDPQHAGALQKHRDILEKWIQDTDDQGQYPESIESLRGVLKRWKNKAVNPEYDKARQATAEASS
ncbi:MAG: sulfatase [Pirellulales bacterium]|nr:sulfatase [Pirellulales bacterium]